MLSVCGRCHQLSPNPSSQRCSLHCRPPPRGLHAQPQPPAGQQRRALTSRIAAQGDGGAGPGVAKRLVCSLSALIDSSDYEAYACWQVASTRWPGSVPGPASLYVKYLRKVWEAASTPVDGVLLTRVLAAEGVIGTPSCESAKLHVRILACAHAYSCAAHSVYRVLLWQSERARDVPGHRCCQSVLMLSVDDQCVRTAELQVAAARQAGKAQLWATRRAACARLIPSR